MTSKTSQDPEKTPLKQQVTETSSEFTPTNLRDDPLSKDFSELYVLYRKWVITTAWVSVFLLLVLGTASFILAAYTDSSAMFGFGFDAILDVCTSVVVVWRFYGTQDTIKSRNRENAANMFLAVLFLIAAISVAVKAIVYLVGGTVLTMNTWLYVVAGSAFFTTVSLSFVKFYLGYKMNSTSVISDGYSSLACGITALGILISAIVYEINPEIDYLDNVVAMGVSLFLLFYGVKLLVVTLKDPGVSSNMMYCCKKMIKNEQELLELGQ